MRCPQCDGLSVPDARKGLRYVIFAIIPLLVVGLIGLSLPLENLIAIDFRWAYLLPALTILNLPYLVGVFLFLNAKVPLTPYEHKHRIIAKRAMGFLFLIAIIAGVAWVIIR